MAGGAWRATVHRVAKSRGDFAFTFQKIATVKIEGSQPQGGDPASQEPHLRPQVFGRGCTLVSLGLRE